MWSKVCPRQYLRWYAFVCGVKPGNILWAAPCGRRVPRILWEPSCWFPAHSGGLLPAATAEQGARGTVCKAPPLAVGPTKCALA